MIFYFYISCTYLSNYAGNAGNYAAFGFDLEEVKKNILRTDFDVVKWWYYENYRKNYMLFILYVSKKMYQIKLLFSNIW